MFKNYKTEDLLSSPLDPRVDRNIGALCFVGNTIKETLNSANSGICPGYYLKGSNPNILNSFIVMKKRPDTFIEEFIENNYPFIILAKDTERPFNDNLDFMEAYEKNSKSLKTLFCHSLSQKGIWLIRKRKSVSNENYELVTRISEKGVYINRKFYIWEKLLKKFIFINGKACGKETKKNFGEKE